MTIFGELRETQRPNSIERLTQTCLILNQCGDILSVISAVHYWYPYGTSGFINAVNEPGDS